MLKFSIYGLTIFSSGFLGLFVTRKNLIILLMCIELMLLGVNFTFISYSLHLDDFYGLLIALFVLTVAAAESAIGLAILVVYYRVKGNISALFINKLKG